MSLVSLGNFWGVSAKSLNGKTKGAVRAGGKSLVECPYDIFQKDEAGHLRWCGAAIDVPSAKAEIAEFAKHSKAEYFVSDHRLRKMIPAAHLALSEFEGKS